MNRRRALTLIGTVGATGLAGCIGEDGTVTASASPAEIPEGSRAGFQATGPEAIKIDRPVEFAGISRDVDITTWSSAYTSSDGQTSLFLVSTPNIKVAGQSLNPLTRLSGADLVARLVDEGLARAGGDMAVKEIEEQEEITVTVLGGERTVQVFSAILETDNTGSVGGIEGAENGEIPIVLYLLSVTHQEDVLLSVGFHPEGVDTGEDIQNLMANIEHPVEAPNANSTSTET